MCLLFCVQKSLTSLKVDKNLFCTCSGDFLNRLRSWGWWDTHYSFAGFYQLSKLYYSLAQNGRNEEHELTSKTNMTTDVFYCKWLTGLMTFWSNGMNNMLMKDSGVVEVDVLGLISHRLQHSWHQGSAMCWPFLYFLSPLLLLRWSYHAKMLSWVCVCVCVCVCCETGWRLPATNQSAGSDPGRSGSEVNTTAAPGFTTSRQSQLQRPQVPRVSPVWDVFSRPHSLEWNVISVVFYCYRRTRHSVAIPTRQSDLLLRWETLSAFTWHSRKQITVLVRLWSDF